MYSLEKKYSGMYQNAIPGFPLQFRCREHIRNIDVKQTATASGKMDVTVVTMDGRTIAFRTTGDMTIGDIVNKICKMVEHYEP